jgi:hypothetical protein
MASSEQNLVVKSSSFRKENGKICSLYSEIGIPPNIPDSFDIVFQNFYVSTVVIAQESASVGGLKILETKKLMNCYYNEAEAFSWHSVSGLSLIHKGLQKGKPLRFYLVQCSDMWNKIDLKNFKISYTKTEAVSPSRALSSLLPSSIPDSEKSSLSSSLIMDYRVINEACKVQAALKPQPEYFYTAPDEGGKRSSRRKDRRKSVAKRGSSADNAIVN